VRYVAEGVALFAVCVLPLGVPGIASADDTTNPGNLASVQSWPDNACGGFSSWHVINNSKDGSIRATVAVRRQKGTEEWNNQYVYDLAPGTSNFVSCKTVAAATEGGAVYDITAWLVGAEEL